MIKFIVFDFDGVFTDGAVFIDNKGIIRKQYNSKDGMGIALLKKNNIKVGVISGYKENNSQLEILKHLKIEYVALGVKYKIEKLKEWCQKLNINMKTEVAYMGDDLNDMQIINEVNFSGCPSDAVEEIKNIVKFKSEKKGGKGCVRDFCDVILNQLDNKIGFFDTTNNVVYEKKKTNIEKNIYKNIMVLILASDNQHRAFQNCISNVSFIERQIRLLLLTGIKRNDIYVVIPSNINNKLLQKLKCNIIYNNNGDRSGSSLVLGLSEIGEIQDNLLIIHGNVFFDIPQLDLLLNKEYNCAITNIIINSESNGIYIESKNNIIKRITSSKSKLNYPLKMYSGIVFLKKESVEIIKNNTYNNETDIELIFNLLSKNNERLFEVDYYSSSNDSFDLIGGSFAGLDKLSIIKKYAYDDGAIKVENEIKWILNLNDELKAKFPKIMNYEISNTYCCFDMQYYPYPSLRKLILLNEIDNNKIFEIIENILNFVFSKMYINIINEVSDDWIYKKHILRVEERLEYIKNNNSIMKNFVDKEYIILNNKKYNNIKYFLNLIKHNKKFLEIVKPDKLRLIHGDLHFQNILIKELDSNDFILLDPRGELRGSDLYYDMGKLFHSFNGLYDIIHTDQYILNYNTKNIYPEINIDYSDIIIIDKYKKIKEFVKKKLLDYKLLSDDKNWELKCRFTEIMHFSSLFIFHVKNDNIENRAVALYASAIKLIDEFINDYNEFL